MINKAVREAVETVKQTTVADEYSKKFEYSVNRIMESLNKMEYLRDELHSRLSKIHCEYNSEDPSSTKEELGTETPSGNVFSQELHNSFYSFKEINDRIDRLNKTFASELENISQFI